MVSRLLTADAELTYGGRLTSEDAKHLGDGFVNTAIKRVVIRDGEGHLWVWEAEAE